MKPLWLLIPALALVAAAPLPDAPIVKIETGTLRGESREGVEAFLGIPYAAPPVGPLRWRAPRAAADWPDVRDAQAIGPDCQQARDAGDKRPMSEDCLTVNVWRPPSRSPRALPVLVWIHGGAYVAGGSSDPLTWGRAFARDGIVTVTFNYRLGRLGFFALPALSAEDPSETKGNYGLMDQIAALQWVRRNIAAFGGDPRRITVMGGSAGGESALLLAASPMAQGLFQRAIVQSGGGRAMLLGRRLLRDATPTRISAEQTGINFAKSLGINAEDPGALAQLRALPADKINGGLTMMSLVFGGLNGFPGPIEDGRLVTAQTGAMLAARTRLVPMILGSTSNDLGINPAKTKDEAFTAFGDDAATARGIYDPDGTVPLSDINTEIGADRTMSEPARLVATTVLAKGQPVWRFRFSYVAENSRSKAIKGAEHSSDITFAFGTAAAAFPGKLTASDAEVERMMHSYLVNFVKTGDPNGARLPRWPRTGVGGDPIIDFLPAGSATAGPDPWKVRLDLAAAAATKK